uniref:UDP-glucuronosyltransferase n=1 Tax=Glossina morsitans morsitans TaxID=37546 RepID=A0A1B0GCA6_GLOMM
MHSKFAFMMSLGIMFSAWLPMVENATILAVYTFPGKSHYMMHVALIKELIRKGHQITMITALTLRHQNLGSNYTEILIDPVYDYWSDVVPFFKADNIFELTKMDLHDFLKMLEIIGLKTTEHALKQSKVQEIINAKHTRGAYDLLLVEQFYQEPFLALSRIYDIPVVTTSTLGYENHMSQMMGLIQPWSFVPHGFMPYTDQMSFTERLQNSYYSLFEDMHREWIYFPKMDKLVQTYFGHLKVPIPKVSDMEKNVSVMLLNSYAPLTTTRPTIAGMIPVGGMHIYPPRALPEDIQKFLDDAKDGVIYFSLGELLQREKKRQHLNMKKAVLSGYAINLHFQSLTEEILKNSLEELLYNPAYRNNIKHISQIFKDRPLNARDMATYWIEYVVRYRGAPHLRSAGLDLKCFDNRQARYEFSGGGDDGGDAGGKGGYD